MQQQRLFEIDSRLGEINKRILVEQRVHESAKKLEYAHSNPTLQKEVVEESKSN